MAHTLRELSSDFLHDRHHLMAFIRGLVRDPDAAEDIFQEVWLRLADAAEKQTEIEDTAKWCRGVARNLLLHHWRAQRSERVVADSELLDLVETAFAEQDPDKNYWAARQKAMRECIQELPGNQRQVLSLKYERGLRMAEIASRIQRTAAATMMLLSRVRRAVARCSERKLRISPV